MHDALVLLQVPATPQMLAAVHHAFFGVPLDPARLTSLRRDEERSFCRSPYARPYCICAALADGHRRRFGG